jgi:hypothetical protein
LCDKAEKAKEFTEKDAEAYVLACAVAGMQTMTDTPPEVTEMVRVRLMALSGAERFRMGAQMFDAARRMVLASLPPDLTETERKRLLFHRLYGEALPR